MAMNIRQPHFIFFGEGDKLKRSAPTEEAKLWSVDRDNSKSPFSRFVGNEKAVKKMQVAAYHALGHPYHMMRDLAFSIFGPASAGKTTLARIYGETVKLPFVEISPKGVKTIDDVFDHINDVLAKNGIGLIEVEKDHYTLPPTVLFIDEVHALPDGIVQGLLKATEFNDAMMQTESGKTLDTYAATWMIATTDEGRLFDAFRTRFNPVQLNYLCKKDVAKIVKNNHPSLSMTVCELVSHYNPKVPRSALQFARYMEMYQKMHPDMDWKDVAKVVAENEGINEVGLNQNQMKVLEALVDGPVAKKNICSIINRKEEELERYIIPSLISDTDDTPALVAASNRGYRLTDHGIMMCSSLGIMNNGPIINLKESIAKVLAKMTTQEERDAFMNIVKECTAKVLKK